MLSDYTRYLLSIRNSFIRSGVELELNNIQGYEDVFYLEEKLTDLLWFYSILEISGSDERLRGFMFPLNSFYMGKVRDNYFEEYLLYRAGYMEISTSDALLRNSLRGNKKEDIVTPFEEDKVVAGVQYEDEDGFIVYATDGSDSQDDEEDDDFIEYTDSDEDLFPEWSPDEDEEDFLEPEGVSEDDEFIESSYDEEDSFANWGSDDGGDEDLDSEDDEEDLFPEWSYDEDTSEELEEDYFEEQEDEDAFSNWGSDEEYEEDTLDEYSEDDDPFGSWGSDDEVEGTSDEIIEDEDPFSSWGSGGEDEGYFEEDTSEELDEDPFGSWGSDEDDGAIEEEPQDPFSSWGSGDDEDNTIEQKSVNTTNTALNTRKVKSKREMDIESVEKTAQVIDNIANKILLKGNSFKSRMVNKVKNMDRNEE